MRFNKFLILILVVVLVAGCTSGRENAETRGNIKEETGQPSNFDMKPSFDYVCYSISYEPAKNWCFAILNSDESYCDKMGECENCASVWKESKTYLPDMARCYRDVARLKNEKSLCDKIKDFGLKSYDEHLIEECYDTLDFSGEDNVMIYYTPAGKTDISTCIDMDDINQAEECMTKAAIQNENGSICETDLPNFEGQDETNLKYLCYEKYAEAMHDINICEKTGRVEYGHTSMELKSICTRVTNDYLPESINLDNIENKCKDSSGLFLSRLMDENCYAHYAKIKDDIAYCKGDWLCIEKAGTVDDCELADSFKCYWDYAFKEENPEICLKIKSEEMKRTCIARFAFDLKNPSLCDNIETKENCYLAGLRGVKGFGKFLMDG